MRIAKSSFVTVCPITVVIIVGTINVATVVSVCRPVIVFCTYKADVIP